MKNYRVRKLWAHWRLLVILVLRYFLKVCLESKEILFHVIIQKYFSICIHYCKKIGRQGVPNRVQQDWRHLNPEAKTLHMSVWRLTLFFLIISYCFLTWWHEAFSTDFLLSPGLPPTPAPPCGCNTILNSSVGYLVHLKDVTPKCVLFFQLGTVSGLPTLWENDTTVAFSPLCLPARCLLLTKLVNVPMLFYRHNCLACFA